MHIHIKNITGFLIAAFCTACFFSACSSLSGDVQFTTELSAHYADLAELTVQATAVRLKADSKQAQLLQKEIQKAIKNAQSESVLIASLYALLGQMQVVSGDNKSAALNLSQSRAYNPGCEDSFILEALLEKEADKKIKILKEGLIKADTSQRLLCELGILYFNSGSYTDALASFDAALPFMTEALAALYQPVRDRAHEYLKAGIKPSQIISTQFTLEKMILITHNETYLLVWFTGPERWDTGVLFERMKASGWFPDNPGNSEALVRRKDAALFFWYLITRGDSVKLYKYTEKYKARGTSPIEDVPYSSPWFNAVLGIIEEDVMKLRDGKFFDPDALITEVDFRKALQILMSVL